MDDDAFIHVILDNPDDDRLRLVYADWLEENGYSHRAEFIRVQIELAHLPTGNTRRIALHAREAELLRTHEKSWVPSNNLALFFEWRRGFVAVLKPCARGVWNDGLSVLAQFPLAEELEINFCMTDETFRHMPHLPNLRTFGIGGNVDITKASMPQIGKWRTLRRLRLQGRLITDDCLIPLTGLEELRELDLSYSGISDQGLRHLTPLSRLEAIDLSETEITSLGVTPLTTFPRLRRLNLTNTHIWDLGINELVGCRSLEELRIGSHYQNLPLTDVGLAPLVGLPKLRILDLGWWCQLSDAFLIVLRQRLSLEELWFNGARHI